MLKINFVLYFYIFLIYIIYWYQKYYFNKFLNKKYFKSHHRTLRVPLRLRVPLPLLEVKVINNIIMFKHSEGNACFFTLIKLNANLKIYNLERRSKISSTRKRKEKKWRWQVSTGERFLLLLPLSSLLQKAR